MDGTGFDHLTQHLGARLSRRGLLRAGAIGTAGLGIGVVASQQAAAKKGKQRKNKKKGDVNKLCKTQVADCEALFTVACAGDATCLATVQTCCPQVGTCDFGGFFACLQFNQA